MLDDGIWELKRSVKMVTIVGGGIACVHGGESRRMGQRRGSGGGMIDGGEESDLG